METILFPIIIGVVALVVVVFILFQTAGRLLRKVGPNQALIVYGLGGTRVITGGSKTVIPMLQRAQDFSLELMSFDVAPSQDLYTTQGVAVNVEAVVVDVGAGEIADEDMLAFAAKADADASNVLSRQAGFR